MVKNTPENVKIVNESNQPDGLDTRYSIQFESPLGDLSSEFAKAYSVIDSSTKDNSTELYALIYDNNFPVRRNIISVLGSHQNPNVIKVKNYGKITLSTTKIEHFAVIIEKPKGELLYKIFKEQGSFDEKLLNNKIIVQLANGMELFNSNEIVHGRINHNNVFYNPETEIITIGECISDFCGYSQLDSYESLDRLPCHPAAKGDGDFTADYFAIGVLTISMITAKKPFSTIDKDVTTNLRFENGSYDTYISSNNKKISIRLNELLKGFLVDQSSERWEFAELLSWSKKKHVSPPISKINKQASMSLIFEDKEYFSKKYLAYDFFKDWNSTRKNINISDIARWINMSMKRPDIANTLNFIVSRSENDIIMSSEKLSNILNILDFEGPIYYKNIACNIHGIGTFLAYCYIKEERELIQQIAALFNNDLTEYWIKLQKNPTHYNKRNLSWTTSEIRDFINKREMGFGMERCLYEFNKTLPCQSNIVSNSHSDRLDTLLITLNKIADNSHDIDPVDRHIAAFICQKISLNNEMRVKTLQNFPHIAKIPQVIMLALLTVAQSEARINELKGITSWLNERLTVLLDKLHSKIIRKNIRNSLKAASKTGSINSMFQIVASPDYVKKDLYGFQEARFQYRKLESEIIKLKTHSNIERMAYHYGLRISVAISYLVCTIALLYVLFQLS